MAPSTSGINGVAAAIAVGGIVVLWSGVRGASVSDTLRAFVQGKPVPQRNQPTHLAAAVAQAATAAAADAGRSGTNVPPVGAGTSAAVDDARRYLGTPYVWAASDPGRGFDCSGLVNQVYGRDLGLPIPGHPDGQYAGHGPITTDWYVWPGCDTVSGLDVRPGDLVCWPSHIGIYAGNGQMINAPTAGEVVKLDTIWKIPVPIYRRHRGRSALAAA